MGDHSMVTQSIDHLGGEGGGGGGVGGAHSKK